MQIETITEMDDDGEVLGVTVYVRDSFPSHELVIALAKHAVAEDAGCDTEDVELELVSSPWKDLMEFAGQPINFSLKAAEFAERNVTVFKVVQK